MTHFLRRKSLAEQTVLHLRKGIASGELGGVLPGVRALAVQCGVSEDTLREALLVLEREGLVEAGGNGRPRRVRPDAREIRASSTLRIGLLLPGGIAAEDPDFQFLMLQVRAQAEALGCQLFFVRKGMAELGFDLRRVLACVEAHPADAWIVAGAPQHILEWFGRQRWPVLALGGRVSELQIAAAGPDVHDAFLTACRRLLDLGHRRIVVVSQRNWREPSLCTAARAMLAELSARGIATGPYNIPDWHETPAGLEELLESLFRISPPTAIILAKFLWLAGTRDFLWRHQLRVPHDVSLFVLGHDPALEWQTPLIAHTRFEDKPLLQRILRWIRATAAGKPDHEKTVYPLTLVEGGSMGPAKTPPPGR